MTRALATFLVGAAIAICAAGGARADDRARARALFEEAGHARDQGRWDDARMLLERALQHYPQFSIGWNLVTTLERLGDLPEAERILGWMRDGGVGELSAEERTSIVDRLDEISPRLSTILVVAPSGTRHATLDGNVTVELDGSGSAQVRVNPGTHELVVDTPDERRVERSVEARAGASVRVRLEPPELATTETAPAEEDESSSVWSSPWLWIGIGAALIAGGVVTAFLLLDRTADPVSADFVAPGL